MVNQQYYYPQSTYNPIAYPQARNPTYYNQYVAGMQQLAENPPQSQPNSNIIWIQGEAAAKAYICANGTTIALWDSEAQTIYIKSTDMNGRPTMTILDYVNRDAPTPPVVEAAATVTATTTPPQDYVTQTQLNELTDSFAAQIAELTKKLNDFKSKVGNTKKENK